MAPEVLDNKMYTVKADSYSFALVIWAMLSGEDPYNDVDPLQLAIDVVVNGARSLILQSVLGSSVIRCATSYSR